MKAYQFFAGCNSTEEAKKRYYRLAQENHPDHCGDPETMKAINAEFERFCKEGPTGGADRDDLPNATTIETGLWAIERYLIKHYGVDQASRDMAPLVWYVKTGRASCDYLHALLSAKPFVIARALHKGGSYEEALARVSSKLSNCGSV